ncbi:MAG: TonB-dependent receptor [Sphingomonadales bacterium]|nr:TonB-dependent receptor [Sphingomonadales bacterium]
MNSLKYATALVALIPSAALAEEATGTDIVVTASGIEQPRDQVGQAITVIDKDKLDDSQALAISDLLRTVPGVRVARNGSIGGVTSVFIRGGESSQTLVLIDGVRINDPSSPNAAFDFGSLLTGNIDRVEILRGPNSVIWGSQAIGGVVNVRTEEPSERLSANAGGEYGYHNTAEVRANVSGTSGKLSGSVGASYFRTDGISALAAGSERDGYKNLAANGKLKVAFNDTLSLDLRAYYNKGRAQFDDPFGATPDTFPETENSQFVGYVGLNADFSEGRFRNRIAYTRTDLHRVGIEPNVPFSFNVNDLKGKIDRFEYQGAFDVADKVTLVFGIEHERTFASTFFPAGGGAGPDQANYRVTSEYGQLIVRPITGLTLTGGVRHDDYNIYGSQTTFGGNFAYTPNAGRTVFRGTYADGFRAPTLTESVLPFGNPALKAETAKSFDLGIEHNFLDGAMRATATYYHRKSDNQIAFSFTTFQSENIAKVLNEGIELELDVRPTRTLKISAGYNLVNATSRSNDSTFGNRLARRAKDSANASIDWKTPIGLTIAADILLTGGSFDDLANTVRLNGYQIVTVRASYPVSDRFEIFGRIENLFDESYQTVARYSTYGRNAYVGVRAKF